MIYVLYERMHVHTPPPRLLRRSNLKRLHPSILTSADETLGFSHVSDIVKMSKFSLRDKSLSWVRCVLLLSERIFR